MTLFVTELNPDDRRLRQFAVLLALLLTVLAIVLTGNSAAITLAIVMALMLLVVGFADVSKLRIPYRCWMIVTAPLRWFTGEVVLLIVYFVVITPMALMLRVVHRDALQLRPQPDTETYWTPRSPSRDVRQYYRQS